MALEWGKDGGPAVVVEGDASAEVRGALAQAWLGGNAHPSVSTKPGSVEPGHGTKQPLSMQDSLVMMMRVEEKNTGFHTVHSAASLSPWLQYHCEPQT